MSNPVQQAAAILVSRRIDGSQGERLPDSCRPQDLESAMTIQHAVSKQWCEIMDDSIGAWKCGLPSPDKIVVAPIYTRTIDSVAPAALWAKHETARVEPELAFFFGRDLPPRAAPYSIAEVDAAICRTHLALELINSRYADPKTCTFPEMLADGLVNQGLFIGPQVNCEAAKAASEFTITINSGHGESSQHPGRHPNLEPRAPLYWLVEFLRSQGQGIIAGQAVITGSFAGVIELPLNIPIEITYAGLGSMAASFSAKT